MGNVSINLEMHAMLEASSASHLVPTWGKHARYIRIVGSGAKTCWCAHFGDVCLLLFHEAFQAENPR